MYFIKLTGLAEDEEPGLGMLGHDVHDPLALARDGHLAQRRG
jgi:hypothetical protein